MMARALRQHRRRSEDDQKAADRQTASLAALAVLIVLVISSLFVMKALCVRSAVEDCLLSGRRNCDAVLVQQLNR